MTGPTTLVIADDHPLFRRGLTEVIEPESAFRIVGAAGDGESALDLVRRHRPDVALLDLEMPNRSGLEVAAAIRDEELAAAVVMLTIHRDSGIFRRALDLGCRGYILKDSAVTEIVACLHMVASGRPYISPATSGDLLARREKLAMPEMVALDDLTPAEEAVLKRIAQGLTSAEIAEALGNSVKTIEHHRSHISQKLGLTGPQRLLRFALEHKALLE
jgi:DNA-binding NarL/FixJ family response regulator